MRGGGRLVLLAILALPAPALANDGAFHGQGATVFAYEEHRIRMVSERIRIRYAPSEAYPSSEWAADCVFEFENLSDEPVSIQMGFPDHRAFPSREWTIEAFETVLRGKAVKATHKMIHEPWDNRLLMAQLMSGDSGPGILGDKGSKGTSKAAPKPPKKNLPKPPKKAPDPWVELAKKAGKRLKLGFGAAYTWPVRFGPRERLTVKNRYRFGGAGTMGPIDVCMEDLKLPGGRFWHANPPATGLGGGTCSEVAYIVTSGKTWVAPIGEAIIEIDLPPRIGPNHVIPLPPATEMTLTTVKWHFKNFRPSQELRVIFANSMFQDPEDEDHTGFTYDFETPDQVKEWLVYARANGAHPALFKRMHEIEAYSFGIRPPGAPAPDVFNEWFPPRSKQARPLHKMSPAQREILSLLKAAAAKSP